MLEELSKRDLEWRVMAFKICKCKMLADDLVNDMYLRLHNREIATDYYVYRTMKGLYQDMFRKKEYKDTVSINDFHYLEHDQDETTEKRYELLEMLKSVSWFEREVLLQTSEKSLRKCEEDSGVSYQVYNYHKQKGLKKLRKKYGNE